MGKNWIARQGGWVIEEVSHNNESTMTHTGALSEPIVHQQE